MQGASIVCNWRLFNSKECVWECKAYRTVCYMPSHCLHCESNHSFWWMPIALKDWAYLLGGLDADVFQEKCEQNEKVLARRIWTTDLRMSIWYFQLQSSALPTELSRDALCWRKIRRHKVVPGTDDMYVAKPLRTELLEWPWYWLICGLFVCLPCAITCCMERWAQ